MHDREISAGTVIAGALWVASVLIWVTAWAAEVRQLGGLAVIVAVAAGTAQVRSYLIEHYERIKLALVVTSTASPDVTRLPRNR